MKKKTDFEKCKEFLDSFGILEKDSININHNNGNNMSIVLAAEEKNKKIKG